MDADLASVESSGRRSLGRGGAQLQDNIQASAVSASDFLASAVAADDFLPGAASNILTCAADLDCAATATVVFLVCTVAGGFVASTPASSFLASCA